MRPLRGIVLAMGVAVLTVVVVVAPAFATPNLTASSGTRAVAPFITPITSTTSSSTGRSSDFSASIDGLATTLSCRTTILSGYVGTTHTQVRITSLSFGDGGADVLSNCRVTTPIGNGAVQGDRATCEASSASPLFLHVRNEDPRIRGSWNFSLGFGFGGCLFPVVIGLGVCRISVDPGGEITLVYTTTTKQFQFTSNASVAVTVRNVINCPIPSGSYVATVTGGFGYTPDTRRDSAPTITVAS